MALFDVSVHKSVSDDALMGSEPWEICDSYYLAIVVILRFNVTYIYLNRGIDEANDSDREWLFLGPFWLHKNMKELSQQKVFLAEYLVLFSHITVRGQIYWGKTKSLVSESNGVLVNPFDGAKRGVVWELRLLHQELCELSFGFSLPNNTHRLCLEFTYSCKNVLEWRCKHKSLLVSWTYKTFFSLKRSLCVQNSPFGNKFFLLLMKVPQRLSASLESKLDR